jgi:peptidoglycan hydrolase-like protein with peptidoglycan-binding domain
MNLHRLTSTSILARAGLGIVVSAVAAVGVVATSINPSTAAGKAAPAAATAPATPSATPATQQPVTQKPVSRADHRGSGNADPDQAGRTTATEGARAGGRQRRPRAQARGPPRQLRLLDVVRVDGEYGTSTTAAVEAFQRSRDLRATGTLDERTWDAVRDSYRQPTRSELYPVIEKPSRSRSSRPSRSTTAA